MGIFDLLTGNKSEYYVTRSALDEAQDEEVSRGAVYKLVQSILDHGLDGKGPVKSAVEVAEDARDSTESVDDAIDKVIRKGYIGGAAGGFATSLGGFITMPVALPVNVLEFYLQATRLVGAIAHLRGYDTEDPHIRTAILLSLVGSDADAILSKAGVAVGTNQVSNLAMRQLPKPALMLVNKAVGFQLLKSVGEKGLSKLGRGIPLAGGLVGAGVDTYMMKQIADTARTEFPQLG